MEVMSCMYGTHQVGARNAKIFIIWWKHKHDLIMLMTCRCARRQEQISQERRTPVSAPSCKNGAKEILALLLTFTEAPWRPQDTCCPERVWTVVCVHACTVIRTLWLKSGMCTRTLGHSFYLCTHVWQFFIFVHACMAILCICARMYGNSLYLCTHTWCFFVCVYAGMVILCLCARMYGDSSYVFTRAWYFFVCVCTRVWWFCVYVCTRAWWFFVYVCTYTWSFLWCTWFTGGSSTFVDIHKGSLRLGKVSSALRGLEWFHTCTHDVMIR